MNHRAIYNGFTIEFYNQVNTIKTSFIYSFFLGISLKNEKIQSELLKMPDDFVSYKALIEKYKLENEIFMPSYFGYCIKSLIILLYEAFKDDEIRFNKVKKDDWFIFLRNLRNSFSHGIDGIWRINKECSYIRKDGIKFTIKKDWEGTKSDLDSIGGIITILDFINFVEEEVKKYINNQK